MFYPPPYRQNPLHDQWNVVRIEKGKDAGVAWAKIFGEPAPPLEGLYRLFIAETANEKNALFPMWRPPLGQSPNRSLPAPYVYGPFELRYSASTTSHPPRSRPLTCIVTILP